MILVILKDVITLIDVKNNKIIIQSSAVFPGFSGLDLARISE